MSVADVCELEASLRRDADEMVGLERKKKEKDSTAKIVEKKWEKVSEERDAYDHKQQKLLEQVQNQGNRFEVLSLDLSEIKNDCDTKTGQSQEIAARIDRYLLAKNELVADIIYIENGWSRMQEKLRVRSTNCVYDETVRSLQKIMQIVADKKSTLHNLQQFDMAALEEHESLQQTKQDGFLQDTAAMIASDKEQKRTEVETKTEQFEIQTAAERKETEDALSAQKNLSADSSVKIDSLRASLTESKCKLFAVNADNDLQASAREGDPPSIFHAFISTTLPLTKLLLPTSP